MDSVSVQQKMKKMDPNDVSNPGQERNCVGWNRLWRIDYSLA